jgi:hypothetical protein
VSIFKREDAATMFNTFRYYHYSTFGLSFQYPREIKGVASYCQLLRSSWLKLYKTFLKNSQTVL